jgi:hypothetical protein
MKAHLEGGKSAHLATLRAITARMKLGCVVVRIWSVAIVLALSAVAANPEHARFASLAVFMVVAFWMLDAHYLRQARLFRKSHDLLKGLPESEIDYSFDTTRVDGEAEAFRSVFFEPLLLSIYAGLVATIAAVRVVLLVR